MPNTERNSRYVWPFVGIGVGAFAVAIPLSIKAEKQAARSVELYNSALGSNLYKQKQFEFAFRPTNNGLGLTINY